MKAKIIDTFEKFKTWYYQNLNKSVKYFISTSMICDKLQAINFFALEDRCGIVSCAIGCVKHVIFFIRNAAGIWVTALYAPGNT